MRREDAVEEWLPGGLALRAPVAAEADGAEFTLDGTRRADPSRPRDTDRAGVDLSEIDFEGLIALGISELSEIDAFPALAPGVRDILRWSGHV